jgi:glyoxylase-like metal-dependent hydrolase (beta-lactamase superfamily II)
MNQPQVHSARDVAPSIDLVGTWIPIPGLGHFAVNAFLLHSREPVLIDAGIANMHEPMFTALKELIHPADIRWIYLTHVDGDHVGCLDEVLQQSPKARIVTTFLGMSKLGLTRHVPPDRFYLRNPGEQLDAGDRKLLVARPPCFDAPETTMLLDPKSGTLFSSDYFGGLVPAPVESADQIPAAALREGMTKWLTVDSPWIHSVQPTLLRQATRSVVELQPRTVLSTHLSPARGMVETLSENILQAPGAPPFTGPDQIAFEQMLSAMR